MMKGKDKTNPVQTGYFNFHKDVVCLSVYRQYASGTQRLSYSLAYI